MAIPRLKTFRTRVTQSVANAIAVAEIQTGLLFQESAGFLLRRVEFEPQGAVTAAALAATITDFEMVIARRDPGTTIQTLNGKDIVWRRKLTYVGTGVVALLPNYFAEDFPEPVSLDHLIVEDPLYAVIDSVNLNGAIFCDVRLSVEPFSISAADRANLISMVQS